MTARDGSEALHPELGIPGLLRLARRPYRNAVRAAFAEAGFDDVPRNGAYLLARVYDGRYSVADLTRGLGISKQAVSQLVDTMVTRGYIERKPDAEDRRRMQLTLTARGAAAATLSWQAATRTDEELERRLSAAGVAALRSGLIALSEMGEEDPLPADPDAD
ncbi:MAG TPA: MarR family transcriptional regulator [Streptosporangiaceae bacterium]|nr:MarR family transcriptional regulator [Streptosporangiaceae bacterium]